MQRDDKITTARATAAKQTKMKKILAWLFIPGREVDADLAIVN